MTIPSDIRKPGSYSDIRGSSSNNALPSTRVKMLIVAQRLAAGTVPEAIPTRIFSPQDAATFFGAGSIMHRMVIAAFKANPYLVLTGCALDDAVSGVLATATQTFTGTATATGSLGIKIGTDRINLAIDKAKTGAEVATLVAAEINKYPNLPVTAAALSTVVTYTAKNKGTCGNMIGKYNPVTFKCEPVAICETPGIAVAVVGFSAGANDPVMANALTAVVSERYNIIAVPFSDATAAGELADHLDFVSDKVNQRGSRGYMFSSKTLAIATTIAGENAKRLNLGFVRKVCRPSYENAAAFAAIQAAVEPPWLALNDAELIGCDTPDVQDKLSDAEVNTCLWAGVTPFEVGAGDKVRCVRSITTYVKNDANTPDPIFLDSFKIAVADYVREAIRVRHRLQFANAVLKDKHVDGEPAYVITADDIRSANLDVCKRIEREGGLNDVDYYKDRFTSVKDSNIAGKVNSKIPIDIVDAAHILDNDIEIVSKL